MPDQFERIANYAKNTCQLDDAADIRARGTRRLRRRRTGQAVLGTGAVAVVTGLSAAMALNTSSHASGRSLATATADRPHPPSTLPFITPSGICAGVARLVTVPTLLAPQTHVRFLKLDGIHFYADYDDPQNHCDEDSYALGTTGHEVLKALQQLGFSDLTTATAPSLSAPAGKVIDIRLQSGTSAFQEGMRDMTPSTPLVIIVSSGSTASNG